MSDEQMGHFVQKARLTDEMQDVTRKAQMVEDLGDPWSAQKATEQLDSIERRMDAGVVKLLVDQSVREVMSKFEIAPGLTVAAPEAEQKIRDYFFRGRDLENAWDVVFADRKLRQAEAHWQARIAQSEEPPAVPATDAATVKELLLVTKYRNRLTKTELVDLYAKSSDTDPILTRLIEKDLDLLDPKADTVDRDMAAVSKLHAETAKRREARRDKTAAKELEGIRERRNRASVFGASIAPALRGTLRINRER